MDMLPSKYIRVSNFWPKSAKKIFLFVKGVQKTKKNEKNFEIFFFIKLILNIIHELCQHLESLNNHLLLH